eukprot:855512-Rhodomonas_salina.2
MDAVRENQDNRAEEEEEQTGRRSRRVSPSLSDPRASSQKKLHPSASDSTPSGTQLLKDTAQLPETPTQPPPKHAVPMLLAQFPCQTSLIFQHRHDA